LKIRSIAFGLGLGLLLAPWAAGLAETPVYPREDRGQPADAAPYLADARCQDCHQGEYRDWLGSHHRHAMAEATTATVRGDFDDALFDEAGQQARFYKRDGRFFVRIEGADGEPGEFEVAYTFGYEPLQQYLVAFPDGRLQALDIAWDVTKERWFRLLPEADANPGERLHWTGSFYRWNTTCAACHSTNLDKGFDPPSGEFRTTWSAITVGCQACHGPGRAHVDWAEAAASGEAAAGAGKALPTGLVGSDARTEIELCAPCHSRRRKISDGPSAKGDLLDAFLPSLLREDIYYADGQILEEVYVYGSFLQSRMHQAGVRCSDCHDPHSADLKADGNAVCTQCHGQAPPERFAALAAADYDAPSHHHHAPGSPGAACVNCHMPDRTYMEIDPRRDHSLRNPRPDLSLSLGTPNACTQCHEDRSDAWAAAAVERWFGPKRLRDPHYGEVLQAARDGRPEARAALAELIAEPSQPAIVRATGLSLLPRNLGPEAGPAYARGLSDEDPLVRAAAVGALVALPLQQRWAAGAPLLDDPVRAVRIEAVRVLAAVPQEAMSAAQRQSFERAAAEYIAAQAVMAETAEAQSNLAGFHADLGQADKAEAAYRKALTIEADYVPAIVNLADLYRRLDREPDGAALLEAAVGRLPDSAELHYALGLSRVRQEDMTAAVAAFREAVALAPETTSYRYVLALALNGEGAWPEALKVLEEAHGRDPHDRDVLYALATINRDRGFRQLALKYARRMVELDPGDRQAQDLLRALQTAP
jgi:predicted CXXCH cytochrome family protein